MQEIDALVTSTSRPECLKKFIDSILKHLKYSGKIKWHIHEGATNWNNSWKQADEQEKLIKDLNFFDTIQITRPNTNKAEAMMKLKKHANSEYLLYFEDDHVYFRDINLDRLLEVMDKYPVINQLSFNKFTLVGETRKIPKPNKKLGYKHFIYESRQFDEFETVVAERWHWIGSIWRRSFIMPKWNFSGGYSTKKFNHLIKNEMPDPSYEWDPKWLEKNIGSFILMPVFSEHISWDQRTTRSLL